MNLLSLQGGGVLGYTQPIILADLERRSGRQCCDIFVLIGGCSVGSITGAALAIGIPAVKIQEFFTLDAPKIFATGWIDKAEQDVEQLWRPLYGAANIESALVSVLGQATLRDCRTRFLAIAYDYASDRPVYFKSYEPSGQDDAQIVIGNDSDIPLWQICRASSAAQHFFSGCKREEPILGLVGEDQMMLLDGGNTGDNAPDMVVIAEAVGFESLDKLKMLSLGVGDSKWIVKPADMEFPGLVKVGVETIKIVFSVGSDARHTQARKLLGAGWRHIAAKLNGDLAINDASHHALTALQFAATGAILQNGVALDEFVLT